MHITSDKFKSLAHDAIHDDRLKNGLMIFEKFLPAFREQVIGRLPEFEAMRDQARDIKDHTLSHLDFYLARFEEKVLAQGGIVHWARTGDEANEIIAEICRGVDAKKVIKSKSMVTEEIELNPKLESEGLEVFETDLGEYIIQLRDEKPSHIVGPALHLNVDQVSDTFYEAHQKYGRTERVVEKDALVGEARAVLREHFKTADVGITGANYLIAESGTIGLVTNEGNADLSASLPNCHIVVTGIEKVVPTLDDATLLMRLLVRSATGQEAANYMSFYTGPKRVGDADGPEIFHVVLVDNGRSNMVGTEFQDMLRCIRCGACLNHCPVFTSIGGQAYGSVYSGPMGSVLTPALTSITQAAHLPNASTFCGRCEAVCPVRIPLPKMLRHWREREYEAHLIPRAARWGVGLWAFLAKSPWLYRRALSIASFGLGLMSREDRAGSARWVKKLPLIGRGWTERRDLAAPKGGTFLTQYARQQKERR